MEKDPNEGEKIYEEKYKDLLSPENTYQFFLKMQFIIPKYGKKSDEIYFNFISFCLRTLSKNNDSGSIESLLDLSLKIYKENHIKIENPEFFISHYHKIFKFLPVNVNKTSFKFSFLEYCDNSKVNEDLLYKENIYVDYAIDSIENKYFVQGYRFAIKSKNIDVIFKEIDSAFNDSELNLNDNDKVYFIARTCLELLMNKEIKLAEKLILKYIKNNDNYNSNHPILNFVFILISFLSLKECNFEKYKELINSYQNIINKDNDLQKYLNFISLKYFNQSLEKKEQTGGFNFLNLLNMFGGN